MVQDTTGTFHPCQACLSLTRYILAEDAESLLGQEEVLRRVKHQEMLFDPREQTQCISFLSFSLYFPAVTILPEEVVLGT